MLLGFISFCWGRLHLYRMLFFELFVVVHVNFNICTVFFYIIIYINRLYSFTFLSSIASIILHQVLAIYAMFYMCIMEKNVKPRKLKIINMTCWKFIWNFMITVSFSDWITCARLQWQASFKCLVKASF